MQLCSDPTKCTAALPWAKSSLRSSVLLCKDCTRQGFAIAMTPIETCSSCSCAVTQPQYTANDTAHFCEEQISVGVIAVTPGCCKPVLQGSTGHCGLPVALTNAAVLFGWVTANLYEQQLSIVVIAVTQACCGLNCRAALNIGACILP